MKKKISEKNENKKKTSVGNLERFEPVVTYSARRNSSVVNPENVKTLSLTPKGRLTLPGFIREHYKLEGGYFTVYNDSKTREFLILFHTEHIEGAKKISTYQKVTYYLEIGFQLRVCGYPIGQTRSVKFQKHPTENGIILKLKTLIS